MLGALLRHAARQHATETPQRPGPIVTTPVVTTSESAPAAAVTPPAPPSYEPGICYHEDHAVLGGVRYGVTRTSDDDARLLPCHHNSPAVAT